MKGKYISVKKLEEMGITIRKCEICGGLLPKYKKKWCGKKCKSEARKKFYEENKDVIKARQVVKEKKNCKKDVEGISEKELLMEIRDLLNDIHIELRREGRINGLD